MHLTEKAITRENFGDCCHQFFGKEEPKAEIGDGLTVFERSARALAEHISVCALTERLMGRKIRNRRSRAFVGTHEGACAPRNEPNNWLTTVSRS